MVKDHSTSYWIPGPPSPVWNLAERLELPSSRLPGIGADAGGTGRVDLVRVDSLRVGEARAYELRACVLDLAHTAAIGVEIDGLLGLNFLRSFIVTLDFGRNVLRLEGLPD
jgi:hypothetical protein